MAPSKPHVIEIWADAACTTRPIIGQEYSDLYVQVNQEIPAQCPTPDFLNDRSQAYYPSCSSELEEGDDIELSLYRDFVLIKGQYSPGVDLSLSSGTYQLTSGFDIMLREDALFSFGPEVG